MAATKRPLWIWFSTFIAIIFGLLTIKSGAAVLFFDGAARAAAGRYVPFVLWFNFLAGFFYVITGIGLWLRRRWAVGLAGILALTTLGIFAMFGLHILNHGDYEMRTVAAMTLRSAIWLVIAGLAWYLWPRNAGEQPLSK